MADDRMKNDEPLKNMGTGGGEGQNWGQGQGQQTPGRNPKGGQETGGQYGGGQHGGQHKDPLNMEDEEEFGGGSKGQHGQNRGDQKNF